MKDFTYTDSETQKEYKFSLREPTISDLQTIGFPPDKNIKTVLSDEKRFNVLFSYTETVLKCLESDGNNTDISQMSVFTWIDLTRDILEFMPKSYYDIATSVEKKR